MPTVILCGFQKKEFLPKMNGLVSGREAIEKSFRKLIQFPALNTSWQLPWLWGTKKEHLSLGSFISPSDPEAGLANPSSPIDKPSSLSGVENWAAHSNLTSYPPSSPCRADLSWLVSTDLIEISFWILNPHPCCWLPLPSQSTFLASLFKKKKIPCHNTRGVPVWGRPEVVCGSWCRPQRWVLCIRVGRAVETLSY